MAAGRQRVGDRGGGGGPGYSRRHRRSPRRLARRRPAPGGLDGRRPPGRAPRTTAGQCHPGFAPLSQLPTLMADIAGSGAAGPSFPLGGDGAERGPGRISRHRCRRPAVRSRLLRRPRPGRPGRLPAGGPAGALGRLFGTGREPGHVPVPAIAPGPADVPVPARRGRVLGAGSGPGSAATPRGRHRERQHRRLAPARGCRQRRRPGRVVQRGLVVAAAWAPEAAPFGGARGRAAPLPVTPAR